MQHSWLIGAALVTASLAGAGPAWLSQEPLPRPFPGTADRRPDIFFAPTPQDVVDRMLELARVTSDDVLYDLGCGDGRIVCTAARRYGCRAHGFDIDPRRIQDSEANKARLDADVQKLVRFKKQDLFTLDLSEASVVTLYLAPALNVKLIPQLDRMKKGSRIVSHRFAMKGVTPDRTLTIKSGGNDRPVYLWTVPLKKERP